MTVDVFIISIVGSIAAPLSVCPNIEANIRHAVEKSVARKNTHVTFTRKKVNRARNQRLKVLFLKNPGVSDAR